MKKLFAFSVGLLLMIVYCTFYQAFPEEASGETVITLSDDGITVNGGPETDTVFTSHDIIYYEDREVYDSGNRYGSGQQQDRHSAQEAAAHTVVNITAPGIYRVSGTLSAGQIRVDLGENAVQDANAVVKLILSDADITCTVAPAVLFLNVYECDGTWSIQRATSIVDTSRAGANLILEGSNRINGSHVGKIYRDDNRRKKLWKQDGAIHSNMSLNIGGPGRLDLTADWEGISSELHMTIQGGDIVIRAQNDAINCSEENVSVININGGFLHILSGLFGGDGIDSNGFMVIRDGIVLVCGNPYDSALDADFGTFINGGTVIAFGAGIDLPSADSSQRVIHLTLDKWAAVGKSIAVTDQTGKVVLAYDPSQDALIGPYARFYNTVTLSSPVFSDEDVYSIWFDAAITGEKMDGVYRNAVLERGRKMQGAVPALSDIPDGLKLYDNVSFYYGCFPDLE